MMRRYLNQRLSAARLAVGIETYREQLIDVATEPGSEWMDTRCRCYSLRHLVRCVVGHDRALRWASGCPTARLSRPDE